MACTDAIAAVDPLPTLATTYASVATKPRTANITRLFDRTCTVS
jgi:hypothetical protein